MEQDVAGVAGDHALVDDVRVQARQVQRGHGGDELQHHDRHQRLPVGPQIAAQQSRSARPVSSRRAGGGHSGGIGSRGCAEPVEEQGHDLPGGSGCPWVITDALPANVTMSQPARRLVRLEAQLGGVGRDERRERGEQRLPVLVAMPVRAPGQPPSRLVRRRRAPGSPGARAPGAPRRPPTSRSSSGRRAVDLPELGDQRRGVEDAGPRRPQQLFLGVEDAEDGPSATPAASAIWRVLTSAPRSVTS